MPTDLEQILRSFLAGQRKRQWPPPQQRPARRDWTDMVCFSCGKSSHAATRCPNLDESFPFMQPGWRTEKTLGGFIMIPPRVAMDRRRAENSGRPGRGGGGGLVSRVSGHVRPRDPGGGTVPTVSPRRMTIDEVSHVMELSGGGGGLSWSSPGFRQCGPRRPLLGTLLDGSVLMMILEYDRG